MKRRNAIRFPWDLWLESPGPVAAVAGRDFHQSVRGFLTMLRRQAKRLGVKVHAKAVGRSEVWFRFENQGA